MPKLPQNQKAPRTANPAASVDALAGAHGIVLTPPAYGVDLADRPLVEGSAAAIQRREDSSATRAVAPGIPQPNRTGLPDALKAGIELLSGLALDDVRVRFNSSRPAQLHAQAYTQGSDIYVAPGQERHLSHEAWHVVQQRQGRVRATMQLVGEQINDDAELEHEADVMGRRATQFQGTMQVASIPAVQDRGLAAMQRSAPVRMSGPIPAGGSSYKLVAGEGGQQVGSVMVHAKDNAAIEVTDLGVDQAHREQGIGKLLIASAARTGLQLGKANMALAAQDKGSGRLTQWYTRMGFAQVGVHQSGYPQLEAPIGRVLGGVAQRSSLSVSGSAQPEDLQPPYRCAAGAVLIQRMIGERLRGGGGGSGSGAVVMIGSSHEGNGFASKAARLLADKIGTQPHALNFSKPLKDGSKEPLYVCAHGVGVGISGFRIAASFAEALQGVGYSNNNLESIILVACNAGAIIEPTEHNNAYAFASDLADIMQVEVYASPYIIALHGKDKMVGNMLVKDPTGFSINGQEVGIVDGAGLYCFPYLPQSYSPPPVVPK